MKYQEAVEILDNSIFHNIYTDQVEGSVTYSREVRAYKHPQIELFIIIQEFRDNLHFLKAYGTCHNSSKLVAKSYYGSIITHSYDNGQYHGLTVMMDGYRGCNIQLFLDFLDKNFREFESRMHSLPVMYLQLTAGSNTKKQETILKLLGMSIKNREFYFSLPHALAQDKIPNGMNEIEKDLE